MEKDIEDFIKRKPEFAEVEAEIIAQYLEDAKLFVDNSWPQKLKIQAYYAATCHLMTLDGQGKNAENIAHKSGMAEFASITSASLNLTRLKKEAIHTSDYKNWLNETKCGRAYLQLLTMAKSGPRIVNMSGIKS